MKTHTLSVIAIAGLCAGLAISVEPSGPKQAEQNRPIDLQGTIAPRWGYYVVDGITYAVHEGKSVRLNKEVSLRVTPTGIIGFDGAPITLPPGQMLTSDGRYAQIPPGTLPAEAASVNPSGAPYLVAPPVKREEPIRVPSPAGATPRINQ